MGLSEIATFTAISAYPCHERSTTFSVHKNGRPDMHRRICPECLAEYEVVTRKLEGSEGEVECVWRPVTRIIGDPVATTIAYS